METTIQCKFSTSGLHRWGYAGSLGEYCLNKGCGVLRSKVDGIVETIVEEIKHPLPTGNVGANIPTDLLDSILKSTKSKACIVITLDEPIMGTPFTLGKFHVSAANVQFDMLKVVIAIISDAMLNRHGFAKAPEGEHPEYGKPCEECGGYQYNHRGGCAAVE